MKSNLLVFPLFTHDITKEEKRSEKLQGNSTVKVISWSQAQTLDTRAKYKIKITRYLPSLFSSAKGQSASCAKSTSYSVTISTRATQRFTSNRKTSTAQKNWNSFNSPWNWTLHLWLVRNEQTPILLFWTCAVIGRKMLKGPGWVHYTVRTNPSSCYHFSCHGDKDFGAGN